VIYAPLLLIWCVGPCLPAVDIVALPSLRMYVPFLAVLSDVMCALVRFVSPHSRMTSSATSRLYPPAMTVAYPSLMCSSGWCRGLVTAVRLLTRTAVIKNRRHTESLRSP